MNLISTIDELKQYIAIDENAKMDTLKLYITEAEQQFLLPLLGKTFYDALIAAYDDVNGDIDAEGFDENLKLIFPYIQRPLSYYAQLLAIKPLSASFGELGLRQDRGQDNDPAPRWMIEDLQLESLKRGDTHAEKLLLFLEENASATEGDYEQWFADIVANTKMSGLIVYGTAIAQKYIDINNSRRVFLQLKATIQTLERRYVPKLVGQDQYDELVTQLQTGNVPAENSALLLKLEPIISKRALYMKLPFMRVSINADGLWLYSDTTELRRKDFLATKEDINALRCQLKDDEGGYLADEAELRQFILDNIGDYPLIAESTVYTVQPDPGPTFTPTNSSDNKHFIV